MELEVTKLKSLPLRRFLLVFWKELFMFGMKQLVGEKLNKIKTLIDFLLYVPAVYFSAHVQKSVLTLECGWYSVAIMTNYYKLSGWKQHKYMTFYNARWARSKRLNHEWCLQGWVPHLCLFQLERLYLFLGLWPSFICFQNWQCSVVWLCFRHHISFLTTARKGFFTFKDSPFVTSTRSYAT